jgi:site-specific recombinase XerD
MHSNTASFNQDTIDAFLAHCEIRSMSPETIRAYRSDLKGMLTAIGTQTDSAGFELAVARWLNVGRQIWAPRTTNRKLASAKSLTKFMGLRGFLDDYIAPTPERLQPHPLPEGLVDLRAMLQSTTDVKRRALIALCGLCGLRIAEALAVTVTDFDLVARTLHVRGGKGAKDRILPVSAGAWEYLGPCVDLVGTGPLLTWNNRRARQILTDLGAKAGVSRRVASHDLRSTLLTEMYRSCKDIRTTQQMAGHASFTTTERYIEVRQSDMRDALEGMTS